MNPWYSPHFYLLNSSLTLWKLTPKRKRYNTRSWSTLYFYNLFSFLFNLLQIHYIVSLLLLCSHQILQNLSHLLIGLAKFLGTHLPKKISISRQNIHQYYLDQRKCKIRKTCCSSSSSSFLIRKKYRFRRAILMRKRGGSCTTVPTWGSNLKSPCPELMADSTRDLKNQFRPPSSKEVSIFC